MKFSLQALRSKLRFEDRTSRIVLIVVLLAVIGYAGYHVAISVLSSRHYDAAALALERYDYFEAADHLKKYLALRPADPNTLLLAAQTSRRGGNFDEAIRLLKLAHKNGASAAEVDAEGQLLNVQGGDLSAAPGLGKYCEENPDSPEAAMALEAIIEGSLRASDIRFARWAVEKWLKHRTGKFDHAQGLVWRGRMNITFRQDFPPPQEDFRHALELAPDHYQARLWLATWLVGTEPRQAIPHLEILRKRRPDDVSVRFQMARLHRSIAELEEAKNLLDELLAGEPSNKVPILVERARVALDMKRPRDAEYFLQIAKSVDRTPRRDVLLAMADCMRQLDRLNDAKMYQDAVKELDAKTDKTAKVPKQ